jgi:hypothetical protein
MLVEWAMRKAAGLLRDTPGKTRQVEALLRRGCVEELALRPEEAHGNIGPHRWGSLRELVRGDLLPTGRLLGQLAGSLAA